MKINGYSSAAPRATYKQNTNNTQPSFGNVASRAFETLGKACDIEPNGSLTRTMFFLVATVFMLGGRFFESRSNDEKREVVTRDVPAVALSVAGAPMINKAVAYAVTKKSGVPILTNGNPDDPIISIGKDKSGKPKFTLGKQGKIFSSSFASQKQIIDWYSGLENMDDALVNFSETVDKHGGKLEKVFKKLGLSDLLHSVTDKKDNKSILDAIKEAKANGSEGFKNLENALKAVPQDNNLLKFAKKAHAYVKLGGIGFMAATLGYFLPHLNIITTKKKYQKKLDEGKISQADFDIRMQRTSPVFRVSSGILSFHRSSAQKTFKNLLSMMEASSVSKTN